MASRRSIRKYAKQAERDVAKAMGGERIPQGAYGGIGDADVRLRGPDGEVWAYVQVKHYAAPEWLRDGNVQAKLAALNSGRPCFLALKDKPGPGSRREPLIYVIQEVSDWVLWNGRGEPAAAEQSEKGPD